MADMGESDPCDATAWPGLSLERNPHLCSDNGMTMSQMIQSIKKHGSYFSAAQKILSFECYREKDGLGVQTFLVEVFDRGEDLENRALRYRCVVKHVPRPDEIELKGGNGEGETIEKAILEAHQRNPFEKRQEPPQLDPGTKVKVIIPKQPTAQPPAHGQTRRPKRQR